MSGSQLDAAMSDFVEPETEKPVDAPMYRVDMTLKVPVSKHHAGLWKSRIDAGKQKLKPRIDAWDEAIRYYNNSQLEHRQSVDGGSGNRYYSKRRNNVWSETENVVYANVQAIMPAVFAKNPQVSLTTAKTEIQPFVATLQRLTNTLATLSSAPGLNLQVHAEQCVVATELCNLGWLTYGYTTRADSSIVTVDELNRISNDLVKAKDQKTIMELEGQLMALEEELDIANPAGPFVRYMPPHDVVVDPDSAVPDYSDAKWIAFREVYPTSYLNAKFGKKDKDGKWMSVYQPTSVLLASAKTDKADEYANFKLFTTSDAKDYGYDDKKQLDRASRTVCWRVFDRVTRRVYLFADNKWDWPIWAVNDPYGLPGFFPAEPMFYNITAIGNSAHGNVVYYLDQQDALNEIADEKRRARQDLKETFLFNDKMDRESVVKWLQGGDGNAQGVKVPEGSSLKDMLYPKPNTMMQALPLFDPNPIYQAIDRLSGVSEVLRNAQFKTNTTNKAIERYDANTAMRLDARISRIEDVLGKVMFGVAFLCAQFMTAQEVTNIIGQEGAAQWQNYDAAELRDLFSAQAVGGSTQKPTSQQRKQQAMELAEIFARFVQIAPLTAIQTTLQVLNSAFDEINLPPNLFEGLAAEVEAAMQRGNSTQGGGDGGSGDQSASTEGGNGGSASSDDAEAMMAQVAEMIDSLPPEAKMALGQAMAQGAPVSEALPEVLAMVQGGEEQQTTQQQGMVQ
jgi:hypothetical protein